MTNDIKKKILSTSKESKLLEYLDKMLSVHDYTLMQENEIILDTLCEWIIAFKNDLLTILNSIEIFKFKKLTFINFLRIKVLVKIIDYRLGSANFFNDDNLNEIYKVMKSKVIYIDKWMVKNWKKILSDEKLISLYLIKYIELYASFIKQENCKEFILLMSDYVLATTIEHLIRVDNLRFLSFKKYFSNFDLTFEKKLRNQFFVLNEYINKDLSLKEKKEYVRVLSNFCKFIVNHKIELHNLLFYSYKLTEDFELIYKQSVKKFGFKTNLYKKVIEKLEEIENYYLLDIRYNFMPTNEYANSRNDFQNFVEIIEDINDISCANDLYNWIITKIPQDLFNPNYFDNDIKYNELENGKKFLSYMKYEKLKNLIEDIKDKAEFLNIAMFVSEKFLDVYKTFFHKSLIKFIDKFPALNFTTILIFYNIISNLDLTNKGIEINRHQFEKDLIIAIENILNMISENEKKLNLLELLDDSLVIKYFSKTIIEVLKCYLYEIQFNEINKTYGFNLTKKSEESKNISTCFIDEDFIYFLFILTAIASKMFLDEPIFSKKYQVKKS